MKKYIAVLVATFALATTACSTTHCHSVQNAAPQHYAATTHCCHSSINLAGDWKMGGPFNIGQSCHVLQTGTNLTFVNERGDKSDGVLVAKRSEVIALDWEGGLTGELTDGTKRINWRNGTWWLRD